MKAASLEVRAVPFLDLPVNMQVPGWFQRNTIAALNSQSHYLCGGRESEGVSRLVVQAPQFCPSLLWAS